MAAVDIVAAPKTAAAAIAIIRLRMTLDSLSRRLVLVIDNVQGAGWFQRRRADQMPRVGYQSSAGLRPLSTSARRSRVARVVSAGSASGAKKPCAMISWFGCGGASWRDARPM